MFHPAVHSVRNRTVNLYSVSAPQGFLAMVGADSISEALDKAATAYMLDVYNSGLTAFRMTGRYIP